MKPKFLPALIVVLFVMFLSNSCQKDNIDTYGAKKISIPEVSTTEVKKISAFTASVGVVIHSSGNARIMERGVVWSTHENPVKSDNISKSTSDSKSFTVEITGLLPQTQYYVRAYATNNLGTGYGEQMSFKTSDPPPCLPFTDARDGTTYQAIQIGSQCWMAENLKYLPAVSIPGVGSDSEPHYYVYDFNSNDVNAAKFSENYAIYGVLYNWHAALGTPANENEKAYRKQGVCPDGWYLPSKADWAILTETLGGTEKAGGKLKAVTHWQAPNVGATNASGFTALPGGSTSPNFSSSGLGYSGMWWSSTKLGTTNGKPNAWQFSLSYNNAFVQKLHFFKSYGFSVRCIRDY